MSIYLKKALLDIKSIFLFLFIFAVLIYNFSIGTTANYSNFDIYDIGVGFFQQNRSNHVSILTIAEYTYRLL